MCGKYSDYGASDTLLPFELLYFERFYRVDKARSRNGSYGLGPAIAESIVKEHGGKVWAESSDGTNAFFMQFPLQVQRHPIF